MRATTARRPSSIFSPSRSRPSNWPTRCCMRCTANRAPRPTRRRAPVERTPTGACVLLVVEDNALNRQVAAELLSSEGARVALADGGLAAFSGCWRRACRSTRCLLRWTCRCRARARRAADPGHDRQRLAGRPRSRLAAGMNDHVAKKPIDKERLVLCLLGHLGRSGARARRQRQRTRANWSRRGAISSGVSAVAWSFDRRGVAALRSGHAGPLRPARTPARRGRCPGSAATLHTIKGSASTVGASATAGRASELEQALRRADPLRGMEILAGIRLDELRTLCDACLLRLQAMFGGDVQAESAS